MVMLVMSTRRNMECARGTEVEKGRMRIGVWYEDIVRVSLRRR